MSLEQKLLQLDEYIWQQHEKITQKANKELGWNKYDLARLMEYGAVGSYLGAGIYSLLYFGVSGGDVVLSGMTGLIYLGISFRKNNYIIPQLKVKEEREINYLIEYGTTKAPQYYNYRPVVCFFSALSSGLSYEFLINSQNELTTIAYLSFLTIGIGQLFDTSSSYFHDQIMTPPTKKKPFWKTLYEKATSPFRQKELVPSSVENNYQTIDEIV